MSIIDKRKILRISSFVCVIATLLILSAMKWSLGCSDGIDVRVFQSHEELKKYVDKVVVVKGRITGIKSYNHLILESGESIRLDRSIFIDRGKMVLVGGVLREEQLRGSDYYKNFDYEHIQASPPPSKEELQRIDKLLLENEDATSYFLWYATNLNQ